MKEKYIQAMAEVVLFDNSDVISTSGCGTAPMMGSAHGECKNKNSYNGCTNGQSNGNGEWN